LHQIKYIAKYGNASIHHKNEWVKVDQTESTPTTKGEFVQGVCNFPSAAFVRIFYENIGTAEDA